MNAAQWMGATLVVLMAILSGCTTTIAQYRDTVGSFRDGYATAAPALGLMYSHLNDFEREVYLARASCDPTLAVLEHTVEGTPTPLGEDRFPPDFIQARVDAIALLGGYADRLAALASPDGVGHFATTGTQLANHLATLAERFAAFVDATAQAYAEPVRIVVDIISNALIASRQDEGVRAAILAGARPVGGILDLLERDLGDAVRQSQASGYNSMIAECSEYYNVHRDQWTPRERRSVLRQLVGIARRRARFRAANPVELVRAMREANDALVRFAGAPSRDPGRIEQLANAMGLFTHRVQQTAAGIRQLAEDESDDDTGEGTPSH